MNIKIAIADDHPMIVDGLQSILLRYPHIKLIGSYLNGTELLRGLTQGVPDVLLLDIQLPDQTGDQLTPVILKSYPAIKILILTNFDSTLYVNNMLKLGAHGYLLKTADKNLLVHAIETVYNGGQFIEEAIKNKLEQLDVKKASLLKVRLTQREKEVLQLIVDGNTAQEIANKLFLGLSTVQNYRNNILLRLNATNTAALVKIALRLGLVE